MSFFLRNLQELVLFEEFGHLLYVAVIISIQLLVNFLTIFLLFVEFVLMTCLSLVILAILKTILCCVCTSIHVCVLPVHVCAHVCVTRACIHVDACTPRTAFGGRCLLSTMLRQSYVFLWLLCFSRLAGLRASVPASKLTADTCHCTLKCVSFRQRVLEVYYFFFLKST